MAKTTLDELIKKLTALRKANPTLKSVPVRITGNVGCCGGCGDSMCGELDQDIDLERIYDYETRVVISV